MAELLSLLSEITSNQKGMKKKQNVNSTFGKTRISNHYTPEMLPNSVKVKQGMGGSVKKPRGDTCGQRFQRRPDPPNQGPNEALLGALRTAQTGGRKCHYTREKLRSWAERQLSTHVPEAAGSRLVVRWASREGFCIAGRLQLLMSLAEDECTHHRYWEQGKCCQPGAQLGLFCLETSCKFPNQQEIISFKDEQ